MKTRRVVKKRGVALVLAMLTSVILVTLSLAFLSLSISEARTSRAYGFEETSVQAASYGLEYGLVYMGHGTTPLHSTWEFQPWPNPGGNPSFDFGFYNVLKATTGPVQASGFWVTVSNITQDPTLESFVPGNLSEVQKNQLRKDLRRLRFVMPNTNQQAVLRLSDDLAFTCEVVFEPLLISQNQGRHDFKLTSTARIYDLAPEQTEIGPTQQPRASRVIEARVKESSFDYAHFVANGRSWNVQGQTIATLPAVPDPNNPGNTIDLADYVMIPRTYEEQGPMRIDGQDPSLAGNGNPNLQRVVNNSGNLKFQQGTSNGGVKFTHPLFINRTANVFQDAGLDDSTMAGYIGGFNPSAQRVGIPDFRKDDMIRAAQLQVDNDDRSGYISVPTSDIPGAVVGSAAPVSPDPQLGPFYEGFETIQGPSGPIQVPKAYDFRPRFPNIEVTLSGNSMTIRKRNTFTGQEMVVADDRFQGSLSQSQLAMGILYVEGGNVVVKTEAGANGNPQQKFTGRLSIAAGEFDARETLQGGADTIYAQAAREFYNYERSRWDTDYRLGRNPVPGNYKAPPYSIQDLQEAKNAGLIQSSVPSGVPANRRLWPAPDTDPPVQGQPTKFKVEREGNVVIADDVAFRNSDGNTLGLFSQNFVLLNDNTPDDNSLTIDAVLMSKERSVSMDWDNTGRQDPLKWAKLMQTVDGDGNPAQRTVTIRGAVIGEYIDVEGDDRNRGFTNQKFIYDNNLRNASPPLMPRPNLAALPGGFRYMILHYLDRGTLSTAGLL